MEEIVKQQLATFFGKYKQHFYKKGEILIRAEDTPPGIFYLTEGEVKVYAISQKGEEIVVNIFKPVSFFPMAWAMNSTPNDYFFEAASEVVVHKAPKEEVITFLRQHPDVVFDLLRRVYKGVDGILLRMVYLMSGSAYSRLVVELIIQAKRFGKFEGQHVELSLSEIELAAQSGMTRETVSREMKLLKDKGLVTFKKNLLVIPDFQQLEQALTPDRF